MPLPLMIPLIAGGLAAAGNIWAGLRANEKNIQFQKDANRQNEQFVRENNELARRWALEDRDYENRYNSLEQQMQRLRDAGLSPNLVYGNGSAANTSASVRGASPQSPQSNPASVSPISVGMPDISGIYNDYYRTQNAESDLMIKELTAQLLSQKMDMNAIDMVGKTTTNETKQFDLGLKRDIRDQSVQSARLANEYTQAQISDSYQKQEYRPLEFQLERQRLRLAQQNSAVQRENILADTAIKVFEFTNMQPQKLEAAKQAFENDKVKGALLMEEYKLRAAGLNPSDPAYMRAIVSIIYKVADNFGLDLGQPPPVNPLSAAGQLGKFGKILPKNKLPGGKWPD